MRVLAVLVLCAAVAAAASAAPSRTRVLLRATSLGSVLADGHGRTLYLFEADRGRRSACYGACAAVWPPLLAGARPLAGPGVRASLLGTAKRRDGKLQVTYAGHPLYLFAKDVKAGQTNGEGIDHFGGGWYALDAAGAKVEQPAPSSGTPTTPAPPAYGGGGGY